METIKETKYLIFKSQTFERRKTKVIYVINKSSGNELATIEWYGSWRQYCFMPCLEYDTVWNNTCLTAVISVIDMLMHERQIDNPKGE